jgi:hypothetical protein
MSQSSTITEVTFEANLLCFHDLEDGSVCLFEGEVDYTIILEGGHPWDTAEGICPQCGNTSPDEGVVLDYLNNL